MLILAIIMRIRFCILLLTLFATGAYAQSGADVEFADRLISAYESEDGEQTSSLIERNRLRVKPVVQDLVTESISALLRGDVHAADRTREMAASFSSTFARIFGERSLSEAVSYLEGWSQEQLRAKLWADSLFAVGSEQRAVAEAREEALRNYRTTLGLYRDIGDRIGEATTLGGIGFVYWYLKEPDSTLSYLQTALEARRAIDDQQLLGNSYNDIAGAYYQFWSDYERAANYYRSAIEIRSSIGDSTGLAKAYNYLGITLWDSGDLDEALPHFEKAIHFNRLLGNKKSLSGALENAGRVLMDLGRNSEGLQYLERSLEIRREESDPNGMIQVLTWIGAVQRRLGDFESAIETYQEVLRLAEETGNERGTAYGLLNLAVTLNHADRPELAATRFEKALQAFRPQQDRSGELKALFGLSNTNLEVGAFAEAEVHARSALDLSRELRDKFQESRALITLANVQVRTDAVESAPGNYAAALELARLLEDPELEWLALMGWSEYFERSGDVRRAVQYYTEALDLIEELRGFLQTEEDKAGFLSQKRFAYESVVHLLSTNHNRFPDAGYDREAFQFAERAKARAFLDLLGESVAGITQRIDESLLQRRTALLDDIAAARREVQGAAAAVDADQEEIGTLRYRLKELENAYSRFQREIRSESPAYSDLQYPQPSTLKDVQAHLLGSNAMLLEYAVGDSSSTLWAVTADTSRLFVLANRDSLAEQVDIIRYGFSSPDSSGIQLFAAAARRLYRLLVEPAADLMADNTRLIIVPDGPLHYLPFEALLAEEGKSDDPAHLHYLVRRHAISYGPSASVLLQLQREPSQDRNRPEKQLLAFGDPVFEKTPERKQMTYARPDGMRSGLERLPYSGDEVRAIARFFDPRETDVFVRADATEERVKAVDLQRYRYVHLATHGLIDERRPDFSSVILSQDAEQKEDGFLQAGEIFNLRMNPELLVLSACETGLGRMVLGEGLIGLTRAFMYAGTPSVLVSLWKVADQSTSKLMQHFYEQLVSGGHAKTDALRLAKIRMVDDDRYSHPFYWAPFVLSGDWH